MLMTFLLFFVFVINIGMLVNAKINLQNAADLAAFAGGAVQARQLNQISFLNYEMRRQYKKFLFRTNVMGGMATKTFSAKQQGQREWGPEPGTPYNPNAPAVCIIFNSADNFCQLAKLSAIPLPNPSPLDQIQNTLVDQLTKLEQIRQDNCKNISATNKQLLLYWLFNTDPYFDGVNPDPKIANILRVIKGLASGLGIIPKEVLLKQRIETLKDYVNFPPQKGVTVSSAGRLKSAADVAARERTIQAFYSAYYTLGEHTFPADGITMDELQPETVLAIKPIKAEFDVYAVESGPAPSANSKAKDCVSAPLPIKIPNAIPLGFYKDPKVLTYYAVRVTAKAQILFSPFGDLTMKAYAAAQPFGSRIGPVIEDGNAVFTRPAECPNSMHSTDPCVGRVPFLAVGTSGYKDWEQAEVIHAFANKLKEQGGAGSQGQTQVIDQAAMERAYQAAMVPNPIEKGKYNIINDLGDSFMNFFDDTQVHAMWAPVISPEKLASGKTAEQEVLDIVNSINVPQGQSGGDVSEEIKQLLKDGLSAYIQKLNQGKGEDGESMNVAILRNPFTIKGQADKIAGLPGEIFMQNPLDVRTSWNMPKREDFRKNGRTGYSVKIVSFNTLLTKNGVTTDGQGQTWTNNLPLDAEAEGDLPVIQH